MQPQVLIISWEMKLRTRSLMLEEPSSLQRQRINDDKVVGLGGRKDTCVWSQSKIWA